LSRPEEPSGRGQLPRLNSRRARIGDTLVAAVGVRRLEPGGAYSAADLASELAVPAQAVHEVMIDLAAEGLVEPVGDGSFRISAPTVTRPPPDHSRRNAPGDRWLSGDSRAVAGHGGGDVRAEDGRGEPPVLIAQAECEEGEADDNADPRGALMKSGGGFSSAIKPCLPEKQ
jgi:hypothetical protein